jgi:hypothetical protein
VGGWDAGGVKTHCWVLREQPPVVVVSSGLLLPGLLPVVVGGGVWVGWVGAAGRPDQLVVRGFVPGGAGGAGWCWWWARSLFENCTVDASIFVFCG